MHYGWAMDTTMHDAESDAWLMVLKVSTHTTILSFFSLLPADEVWRD